jgi:putative transferase (TIGR04331 family)
VRDPEIRDFIAAPFSDSEKQSKFEQYFCHCLKNSFPWSLAEGFQESFQIYERYWNSFPELDYLVTENQYQHNSLALATFSLLHGKLVSIPHFYTLEILANYKLDKLQSGSFFKIDRGYTKTHEENSVGSGSIYPYVVSSASPVKKYPILYVATEFTPYLLDYQISIDGDGYEVYEKFKIFVYNFFEILPKKTIKKIWLKERSKPRYDGVTFKYPAYMHRLDAENTAPAYMAQSSIIIVEGMSTAFYEALASNIPVLTFWPQGLYHLDENYSDFFQDLEFVGLIHHNPLQLSQMLINIEGNPSVWWQSERVQLARASFLQKNFHLLPEMKKTLLNLLKK